MLFLLFLFSLCTSFWNIIHQSHNLGINIKLVVWCIPFASFNLIPLLCFSKFLTGLIPNILDTDFIFVNFILLFTTCSLRIMHFNTLFIFHSSQRAPFISSLSLWCRFLELHIFREAYQLTSIAYYSVHNDGSLYCRSQISIGGYYIRFLDLVII